MQRVAFHGRGASGMRRRGSRPSPTPCRRALHILSRSRRICTGDKGAPDAPWRRAAYRTRYRCRTANTAAVPHSGPRRLKPANRATRGRAGRAAATGARSSGRLASLARRRKGRPPIRSRAGGEWWTRQATRARGRAVAWRACAAADLGRCAPLVSLERPRPWPLSRTAPVAARGAVAPVAGRDLGSGPVCPSRDALSAPDPSSSGPAPEAPPPTAAADGAGDRRERRRGPSRPSWRRGPIAGRPGRPRPPLQRSRHPRRGR